MSDVFHSSGIRVQQNGACKAKQSRSTTNRGFYIMLHLMHSTLSTLPLDVAFSPILFFKKRTGAQDVPISTFSPIQPAIPA
jgi:hypothetical protein